MYCENGSAKEKMQIHNMNTRYLNQYIYLHIKNKKEKRKEEKEIKDRDQKGIRTHNTSPGR